MNDRFLKTGFLLLLAITFTVGLTFATVEFPSYIDQLLQDRIHTPGADSHVDTVSRIKTDLFMAHYHVRAIGYVGFFLLLGLIVAGFTSKRTGLATVGALGVMLTVFAQFAGVMFFLAGLGILNALWLPILDMSYEIQNWGLVIRAPNDFLRWILGLFGIHSPWPTILFFIASGILIFLLGTYAWLTARTRGNGVADRWVYRLSRHPQYLGWILWTYGAFLLIQLARYPRRSWGIGASLPWLISTMVIVGVAMMEELNMRKSFGEAYDRYRKSAPFLFPVPRFFERVFAAPLRFLFRKELPTRRREVAVLVGVYTSILVALSAFFYAGGLDGTVARLSSPETRAEKMQEMFARVSEEPNSSRRYLMSLQLVSFGEPAVEPLAQWLEGEDPELRVLAAELLDDLPFESAVPALCKALSDSVENVRYRSVLALNAVGSPRAAGALTRLLDDPEGHIRNAAFAGLASLHEGVVLDRAPEFLQAQEGRGKTQILDALGALGSEAAIPLVEESLHDESARVRQHAVLALLRIGSPTSRKLLEGLLADRDFEVRLYAEEALKRLPPAERASLLPSLDADPEPSLPGGGFMRRDLSQCSNGREATRTPTMATSANAHAIVLPSPFLPLSRLRLRPVGSPEPS